MAIISAKNSLCSVINSNPDIIPLINRFGITLGVKDKTIESICNDNALDIEFFISILNTYINEDFFPEKILKSFRAETIVNYISQTYNYYIHYMLPNIERHFNLLIAHSGDNNNLGLMFQFFKELKNDILQNINHDIHQWFPLIISASLNETAPNLKFIAPSNSSIIEDKINDLKNMFIIHLTGKYDLNLCYAVISSIISFEKDIRQNNRIRNRILYLIYKNTINK